MNLKELSKRVTQRLSDVWNNEHGRVAVKEKSRRTVESVSPVIAFTGAAHEHVEPGFDRSYATDVTADAFTEDVPAYGFARHLAILLTNSGGVAGPGVLHEDSPFRAISEVSLIDVNGAPIIVPIDGYDLFLINLFGGYAGNPDARSQPDYSAAVDAFSFILRVPIEISHHDGLGALPNQNSAEAYKVRVIQNTLANIYSTAPTTAPTTRFRSWLEAWSQPSPQDMLGRPQAMTPPYLGTSQYWRKHTTAVSAGFQTVKLPHVGNLIRNIILIYRVAGARSTAGLPDSLTMSLDGRQLTNEPIQYRRAVMQERLPEVITLPTGVLWYSFAHGDDNVAGDETPNLWLPTVQASRLELSGTFDNAGELTVLTNEIAPVEVDPGERYQFGSETGFTPEQGTPIRTS